jgi:hypothetical protein
MEWIQLARTKMQAAGCYASGDELAFPMKYREFFTACQAAFLFTFGYDVMKATIISVLLVLHYGRTGKLLVANCLVCLRSCLLHDDTVTAFVVSPQFC